MKGALRIIRCHNREAVSREVAGLPNGFEVIIREPSRTTDQNAKMWAMLSDISRAMPEGRQHPAETWKALFMHALGFETQFQTGLNGEPFPVGFRTSRLRKAQMVDLITFISEYGDRHGVQWSEPNPYEMTP
ncbi:recombination protein NinB [Salipiger sp. 1_MG-2023]|uniref:recombination protein NinB n=1 Tax=Salipiger sp. 1_MG-2023 TaxID=3062665 RepID=UPI0026E2C55E|nr:recombination protein NinB [Salipiger sp. 1_MG-2023]MDO6587365.1 recombination protein NinB [Salipiger sp. 1_MG-2023]